MVRCSEVTQLWQLRQDKKRKEIQIRSTLRGSVPKLQVSGRSIPRIRSLHHGMHLA